MVGFATLQLDELLPIESDWLLSPEVLSVIVNLDRQVHIFNSCGQKREIPGAFLFESIKLQT